MARPSSLRERLLSLASPIRVGLIGGGSMGRALAHQCAVTPGLECVAVADLEIERAVESARASRRDFTLVSDDAEFQGALAAGKVAVTRDGELLAAARGIDVVVESSSSIGPAARFSIRAITSGKHLVAMNSEVDLIFGPYLADLAQSHGVVFTSCDGDQHTVLKRMIDEILLWGFDLVMAGNVKGFLDRHATPTTIVPEADRRRLGYKMCTAYTDGTKLSVEMALLANGLGLATPRPGMLGPAAGHVREVFSLFDLPSLWTRHGPFVDYLLGAEPGGGVFAVGHCDDPYQRDMMAYYKMGDGPFYLFYRPYHLCHVEAIRCIAEACLDGRALLRPGAGLRTNVYTYAKRDLRPGERLDGIGGYSCYGMIENCPSPEEHPGLPICLAEDVVVRRPVAKDRPVLLADVDVDADSFEQSTFRLALAASRAEPA